MSDSCSGAVSLSLQFESHLEVEPEALLVGPGMVELLEAIRRSGSLRAAATELQMSYMHAWGLVRTMNRGFRDPIVELSRGGAARGGARLSARGEEVLALYREMEAEALRAVATHWKRLNRLLA